MKVAICDLCLNNEIHETVNIGFIYGVTLLFPSETHPFYADRRHQQVLRATIHRRQLNLEQIKDIPMPANQGATWFGQRKSKRRIKVILDDMNTRQISVLLVLSSLPFQRLILKKLLLRPEYQHLRCVMILHGGLEAISGLDHSPTPLLDLSLTNPHTYTKPHQYLAHLATRFSRSFTNRLRRLKHRCLQRWTTPIDFKEHLRQDHSPRIRYIVLSSHIIPNVQTYIDPQSLNFCYLPHPAVFYPQSAPPQHNQMTFAVFGYGNPGLLQRLNLALTQLNLTQPFEIRVIGANHQGVSDFPWMTSPIQRTLSRVEMEELAQDIDAFLILYEPHRYRLSCSGSIVEALSMHKPIFYLENECIRAFDHLPDVPLGISAPNVGQLAEHMSRFIEEYPAHQSELLQFREHIEQVRQAVDITHRLEEFSHYLHFDA